MMLSRNLVIVALVVLVGGCAGTDSSDGSSETRKKMAAGARAPVSTYPAGDYAIWLDHEGSVLCVGRPETTPTFTCVPQKSGTTRSSALVCLQEGFVERTSNSVRRWAGACDQTSNEVATLLAAKLKETRSRFGGRIRRRRGVVHDPCVIGDAFMVDRVEYDQDTVYQIHGTLGLEHCAKTKVKKKVIKRLHFFAVHEVPGFTVYREVTHWGGKSLPSPAKKADTSYAVWLKANGDVVCLGRPARTGECPTRTCSIPDGLRWLDCELKTVCDDPEGWLERFKSVTDPNQIYKVKMNREGACCYQGKAAYLKELAERFGMPPDEFSRRSFNVCYIEEDHRTTYEFEAAGNGGEHYQFFGVLLEKGISVRRKKGSTYQATYYPGLTPRRGFTVWQAVAKPNFP